MKIEDKIKTMELYDIYYLLLTKRQQNVVELFLDEDYSVNEISEKLEVSSAAISKTLKQSWKKLEDLEEKLGIKKNYEKNIKLLEENSISEEIIKKIKK